MFEPIADALRRGAHDEALSAARDALAAMPQDAQAHRWLAAAHAAAGDRAEALDAMQQAIALAPDDADLHFLQAGLLLGSGQGEAARAALAHSVTLDPNQFAAYILQAQLALGRGDLDEAQRQQRLAARLAPSHVWVRTIEGMLALRRGQTEQAQALLAAVAQDAPDDPQVRYALGFAYLAGGHHAFAEQVFRGVVEAVPGALGLRGLIADLMRLQGRPAEAARELEPLLADARHATPALRRFAGELQLAAGRHDLALPLLREALAAQPRDRRTYNALLESWQRSGDTDDARATLDTALQAAPDHADAWRARLALEPIASDAALAVIDRWDAAMPDHLPVLEARMAVLGALGRSNDASAVAEQIVARAPGHGPAELRLIDAKVQRDPAAAVAHIDGLLAQASEPQARRLLEAWKALAQDRAGNHAAAALGWEVLRATEAAQRLPLPELTAAHPDSWPELAPASAQSPAVAFLVGLPGSGVDHAAQLLAGAVPAFRADRFGPQPPQDPLQNYHTPWRLQRAELTPADAAQAWQAALPARGIADGQIVDWLLWWDNAMTALVAVLPGARLVVALRDPRDMLLDWLVIGGGAAPLRMESPATAARWMAQQLEHMAALHDAALSETASSKGVPSEVPAPHIALLRLDETIAQPQALAIQLGEALDIELPEPPASLGWPQRFAAGHWRQYGDVLAEPFALLTPIAVRFGYPDS